MKTKEFKDAVTDLGFKIKIDGCWMIITTLNDTRLLKTNSLNQSVIFFRGNYNCQLDRKLLILVTLYINTPSEEREEEKRYWLQKIPVPLLGEKRGRYFCKALVPNYQNCVDIDRSQNSQFQTIFTESEIAGMDITGFQKVEVTE
jgi:hypothetical protein